MIDTTWFYAPPANFRGEWVELPSTEAHHVNNVLRGGAGEEITVVDGVGGCFHVQLEEVHRETVVGRILDERQGVGEPAYDLTIAIGILKKRSRFETFLEKAVELGVGRIIPLITEHGEKEAIRRDRAERILRAGIKQTRRSRLPVLSDPQTIDDLVESAAADLTIVCHGGPDVDHRFSALVRRSSGERLLAAIGPEGGFSGREISQFLDSGWETGHLGDRRLRSETAGIAVAAAVQAIWDSPGSDDVSRSP